MTVADNLRAIATEAEPAIARYMDLAWSNNLVFMSAYSGGFLDELWSEMRPKFQHLWLHYFIRARGIGDIKIGKTNSFGKRFDGLLTGLSRGADLVACYPAHREHEKELHEEFRHCRLNGEWFAPHEDLLNYLRDIGANLEGISDEPRIHRIENRWNRRLS